MHPHALLSLHLLAAGGLCLLSPAGELRFAPAAGTTVVKTFTSEIDFELDDMSVTVDGEDVLSAIGVPEFRLEIGSEFRIVDDYLAVAGGRPTKLQRLFESLGITTDVEVAIMGESQTDNQKTGSDFEGKSVLFTWDEDGGEYTVAWADEDSGDDALLDGLEEDMDLRSLLPAGPVEVGDSWELSLEALQALWMPGGNLGWETEGDAAELQAQVEAAMERFMKTLGEQLTGTRSATYRGTREVDGRELGVIELAIDVELTFDAASMIMDFIAAADELPDEVSIDLTRANFTYAARLGGELLWDETAGLADGLSIEGDYDVTVDVAASFDMMEQSMEFEANVLGSGVQKVRLLTAGR